MGAHIVQAESGFRPFGCGCRQGRMTERMRPQVDPDLRAQETDDPASGPRLEASIVVLAALAARLKQRARSGSAMRGVPLNRVDRGRRQVDEHLFAFALRFAQPRLTAGEIEIGPLEAAEFTDAQPA